LKLTTDRHEASRSLFATELLVVYIVKCIKNRMVKALFFRNCMAKRVVTRTIRKKECKRVFYNKVLYL